MTARLASLLAAVTLCLGTSPALAQDWRDRPPPPPPEGPGPDMRDGPGPIPGAPHPMRHYELRRDGDGREMERRWDGPMPRPGPGMMPPPGGPGPMITYAYPSPYPGWVYPPVAWVKVPIVRERAASCECEEVIEKRVVVREMHRHAIRPRHVGKWIRSTK